MKGISALISSVLLLTVTVSVVSIFAGWAPNLVQLVTDETGNQTRNQVDCNNADVEVISSRFYTSGNTTVVVRNNGRKDLGRVMIEAWQNDQPMNRTETELNKGDLKTLNVSTSSKPDRVEAISISCSEAQDQLVEIS